MEITRLDSASWKSSASEVYGAQDSGPTYADLQDGLDRLSQSTKSSQEQKERSLDPAGVSVSFYRDITSYRIDTLASKLMEKLKKLTSGLDYLKDTYGKDLTTLPALPLESDALAYGKEAHLLPWIASNSSKLGNMDIGVSYSNGNLEPTQERYLSCLISVGENQIPLLCVLGKDQEVATADFLKTTLKNVLENELSKDTYMEKYIKDKFLSTEHLYSVLKNIGPLLHDKAKDYFLPSNSPSNYSLTLFLELKQQLWALHMGNSRGIVLNQVDFQGKRIYSLQLTKNKSFHWKQSSEQIGRAQKYQKRSIEDSKASTIPQCSVTLFEGKYQAVLLATEGFWKSIATETAMRLLGYFILSGLSAKEIAEKLIHVCAGEGNKDNVTVMVGLVKNDALEIA